MTLRGAIVGTGGIAIPFYQHVAGTLRR